VAEPDVALEVDDLPGQEQTETAMVQQPAPEQVETPRAGSVNLSRPPAPRDAPRIDTTEAPRPPQEAEPAEEVVRPTEPEEAEEVEVVEEEEPTAPEEATTAVTPEEENAAPPQLRPQSRPSNMAELVALAEAQRLVEEEERKLAAERAQREREEAERREREAAERQVAEQEQPQPEEQPDEDVADTIAALIDQANEQPSEPATRPAAPVENVPLGPPMTQGEKEGLRFAVQKCWNVPDGIKGAADLRITVSVELAQDGTIVGGPELVSPSSSGSPEVQIAYEAARRAILRCGAKGFDLPADKWGQWRQLEVTFDPGGMLGW
jgi:hypothetical protein